MAANNTFYIAMAPMEGVTTAIYRRIFKKYFSCVDVFYTPFLSLNQTHSFRKREKREYLPFCEDLIPQVLVNNPDDYVWGAGVLKETGYKEINVNLGCPSGTVVTKRKGAGMLADPDALGMFFDRIFEETEKHELPAVSVKTRIGLESRDETAHISEVLSSFPFSEIIIHPRLRSDFYNGEPDLNAFRQMCDIIRSAEKTCQTKIMYNGNINTVEDAIAFREDFPEIDRLMLGRGLMQNPSLAALIQNQPKADADTLCNFIDELYDAYREEMSGERDVLFKMKDLANFMMPVDAGKAAKRIKKAKSKEEFMSAAKDICDLL